LIDVSGRYIMPFLLLLGSHLLERTVVLDRELDLHRRVADLIAWAFEATLKLLVAFSRAEAWAPPNAMAEERGPHPGANLHVPSHEVSQSALRGSAALSATAPLSVPVYDVNA
jgi:hypothetical protein